MLYDSYNMSHVTYNDQMLFHQQQQILVQMHFPRIYFPLKEDPELHYRSPFLFSLFKSRFSIPKHVTHRNFLNEKKLQNKCETKENRKMVNYRK